MSNEENARRLLALVRTLEGLMSEVESALGVEPSEEAGDGEPRLTLVPEPGDDEAWTGFLDEHPELAREPLTFTDEELLAAFDKAVAEKNETHAERPWLLGEDVHSPAVARVLRPCPSDSDCARVVVGLRRLAEAGRVSYLRPRDRRGSGHWVRAGREAHACERTRKSVEPGVLPELTQEDVLEALTTALRSRRSMAVPFEAVHEAVLPEPRARTKSTNARIRYLLVELRKAGRAESMLGGPGERVRLWTCPDEPLGEQAE